MKTMISIKCDKCGMSVFKDVFHLNKTLGSWTRISIGIEIGTYCKDRINDNVEIDLCPSCSMKLPEMKVTIQKLVDNVMNLEVV
jgi:hypothetical protein